MKNSYIFLIVFLTVINFDAYAINDNCSNVIKINSDQLSNDTGSIAKNSVVIICDEEVTWSQISDQGSFDLIMDVVGSSGSWNKTSNTGDIMYELQLNQYTSTMRLVNLNGIISLKISIQGGESSTLNVNQISYSL